MLQVKDLERLLSEADRERRDVREKYVALGRRMNTLQGSEEAHRYGIQVAYPPLCRIAMLRHCPSLSNPTIRLIFSSVPSQMAKRVGTISIQSKEARRYALETNGICVCE